MHNRSRVDKGGRGHDSSFVVDLDPVVSYALVMVDGRVDRRSVVNAHAMVVAARMEDVNSMMARQLRRFGHRRGHETQKDRNLEDKGSVAAFVGVGWGVGRWNVSLGFVYL